MSDRVGSNAQLNSWKEIAQYFSTTVRTVQRWEVERGLPVRRLSGAGRGRVYALVSELEAWVAPDGGLPHEAAEVPARKRRWRLWTALAVLGAAALVLSFVALHRSRGRLASYRVEAHALVATDADGREIWRKTFPEPLDLDDYSSRFGSVRARVEDIDNDGQAEVLWVHMSVRTQPQAVLGLVCFSERGDELWRFVPGKRVSSRVEPFEPPFYVYSFVVGPAGNLPGKSIVVASSHIYYPTQVAVLDSLGHVAGEYWHSGHFQVTQLMDFDGDGRNEIYLAGVANGYNAGTVVVLDAGNLGGASVEENADYQLLGFPPAREVVRLLLPRTCINRKFERYPILEFLRSSQTAFEIVSHEWNRVEGVVFEFARDLRIRRAVWTDSLIAMHARLRSEGRLDHDWSPSEERELLKVRYLRGTPPGP